MTHYPNKDDFQTGFWSSYYKILLTAQGIEFMVNANNEQDAIDYIIDYCEDKLPGLLFSREEEAEEEYLEEYVTGGNHGRTLNTYHVYCRLIEKEVRKYV